jgi:ribulose-bisphosphate carboxylase large chain
MFKEIYEDFVDLKHKPKDSELLCSFYLEPDRGETVKRAAGAVAAESSVGTWTAVPGLGLSHVKDIAAICYEIKGNWVKIAYPLDNFEAGSLPQIFSSIAGNVFGMKAVKNLRLQDVRWPKKMIQAFPGPQFGIRGVRRIMNVKERPLLACVPKPKVGMTSEEHAQVGYDVWTGGVDLLKDDENLTSQPFNQFQNRVKLCMRVRERAERETGERKACLFNITAPWEEMKRRAEFVASHGNEFVMVDMFTIGWSALQEIRNVCSDLRLALYAHRAFHAAFTRNPKHGASMIAVAEAGRLAGVDHIHVGTAIGKLAGDKAEVLALKEIMSTQKSRENKELHLFEHDWDLVQPVMPVSSGGLHPGLLPQIMEMLGNDIVLQAGGGTHGHPRGSKAGAMACRQAIDSKLHDYTLGEYAKTHSELGEALKTWGTTRPK